MRSATYGTHHGAHSAQPAVTRGSRRSGNASSVGFSSPRKAKRANRGYVDQIAPRSSTGESADAYSRRMNRRAFSAEVQHKSRRNRFLFFALTLLLVLAIGGAAAYMAFYWSVDNKLGSGDENLSKVLVAQPENDPYYVLCTADLNDNDGGPSVDALFLARVDQANKTATLVFAPGTMCASVGDTTSNFLKLSMSGSDSDVVKAASNAFGVGISHYLHVDRALMTKVLEDVGGVEVSVDESVDDPRAGNVYLATGVQTLEGEAAFVYLRGSNYADGLKTTLKCQRAFALALTDKVFGADSGFSLGANLDTFASHITTDLTGRQLNDIYQSLQGLSSANVRTGQVAGDVYDGTFVPNAAQLTALMGYVDRGEDPGVLDVEQTIQVDKASFEITVKNGAGVTGGAATLAGILTNNGFKVAEVGNADSQVYKETLVIYRDPAYETACKAIVQTLGMGRVVNGINGYTFDTQVLVMLGSDWKPLS